MSQGHVTLQNLSICQRWKSIRQQYKNKNLKIIAQTWNDVFELPDSCYSVSNTQAYIELVIKSTKLHSPILLFLFTSTGFISWDYKRLKPQNYLAAHIKKVLRFETVEVGLVRCNFSRQSVSTKNLRCYILSLLINLTLIC